MQVYYGGFENREYLVVILYWKKVAQTDADFYLQMKLHKKFNALIVTTHWKQLSFCCSESVVSYMKQLPYKTVQQKVWNVKNLLNKKNKHVFTSNDQEDSLIFHETTS